MDKTQYVSGRARALKLLVDCMTLSQGGGVQVGLAFVSQLMRDQSVQWRCLAPSHLKDQFVGLGLIDDRISYLPKGSLKEKLVASLHLRRIESEFKPDIAFTVFGPAYFRSRVPHLVGFALPGLIYDLPAVLRSKSRLQEIVTKAVLKVMLQRADHFMVETTVVASRLLRHLSIDASRIHVVPNGVNPALRVTPVAPLTITSPIIVFVPSAYYRHKNLEVIPEIAARLRAVAPQMDVEFRLTLEEGSSGWRSIAQAASDLGVAQYVKTVGPLDLDALGCHYNASQIVCMPTLLEASTAVYPESFYFRRPLVTSDLDFARELCGEAAAFASPVDADALAQALVRVVTDKVFRDKLIEEGERRLKFAYLEPAEKYAQQMAILRKLVV